MLSINITGLRVGVHDLALEATPEELDLDPAVFRDIHVELRLDRKSDRIFVSMEATAVATLECDRTLQPFDQPLSGRYQVLFAPPEMVESKEDSEDIRLLAPEDEEIDVTEAVRDTLMLAVPQRKVAPGAEDVDIQTRFGEPRADEGPADPRWEALKKLKNDTASDDAASTK